jgi:outer membrane protein assembly factor BamE (lipoprotein component of BamABCDE complex)
MKKIILLLTISVLFSACEKNVKTGYIIDPLKVDQIKVGKTKSDKVREILGTPSFVSTASNLEWYYVGSDLKQKPVTKPKLTKNTVLIIRFDKKDIVSYISEEDNINKVRDIKFVQESTKTEGNSTTAVEQFLGNLGKYNTADDKDSK